MADIRIKDLTTTASSTASDDFFAADGTTNGTRKLSAYSPSFGGNATVGGTLTVGTESKAQYLTATSNIPSGFTANSSVIDFYLGEARFVAFGPDTSTKPAWKVQLLSSNGGISTDVLKSSAAGVISIPNTSASTSTSSGALVVGNGTSGGLGVGGSVNVGGSLTVSGTSSLLTVANSTGSAMLAVFASAYATGSATPYLVIGSFSDPATSGARIAVSTDYSLDNRAAIQLQTRTTAGTLQTALTLANTRNATFAADVAISGTTASASTSSGALVVSGGVGVAKSLNVGEAVTVAGGSFAAASFYKSASLGTVLSGATGSSYDLYITNPAGNHVMQVPTGTRNAEFAATLTTVGAITSGASISTSAPTGGSGAWELGVYSATAPSATGYVTIEIGGVAYKLLASNV